MTKLSQILLGTLIISSLGCGGSSGSGGGNDGGGGPDGDQTRLDGATIFSDVALPSADQAIATLDQASAGEDQASPALDLGTVKLDTAASPDRPAADVAADVFVQPDLAGPGDVLVERDVAGDLRVTSDRPSSEDLRPPADVPATLDVSSKPETPPALDVFPAIDTSGAVDTGIDTTPQILWPNKVTYSAGEQLTANFTHGSTDSQAWIGIFAIGAADQDYGNWDYTYGVTSGTIVLQAPATPGTYELRMFQDNGYTRIATSAPFLVQ